MSEPRADVADQLRQVNENLLPDEEVYAVYDAKGQGSGFCAITSHRVILQDASLTRMNIAITSIPHRRIDSVSIVQDKSMLGSLAASSTLEVAVGQKVYQIEFRGSGKALDAHQLILARATA